MFPTFKKFFEGTGGAIVRDVLVIISYISLFFSSLKFLNFGSPPTRLGLSSTIHTALIVLVLLVIANYTKKRSIVRNSISFIALIFAVLIIIRAENLLNTCSTDIYCYYY